MGFQKGHQTNKGNHNVGRKTKAEVIAEASELITNEALIELAKSRVFAQIKANKTYNAVKDLALPVTLKGIKDRVENTLIIPKPLDEFIEKETPKTSQ